MKKQDLLAYLLVPLIALVALGLVGSGSTWLTLTVAGLAMGLIIFITASGLTLVFGLMDILNFGHGLFIAAGAYVATTVFGALATNVSGISIGGALMLTLAAMAVAVVVTLALGWLFERVLIRPVYGQHLKQILITMGGMIIGEEMLKVIWGPQTVPLPLPEAMRGAYLIGDAAVEKFRVLAVMLGLVVLVGLLWVLNKTKLGLLIRAGVQDREMVESLGYPIKTLFIGVFCAGAALAGVGGVLWGMYQQNVVPQIGAQLNILIFIVIIIGGLGSTLGGLIGALLVGLVANYTGFLFPKLALVSTILVMVLVLLWRPAGLFPVAKRSGQR